MTPPFPFNLLVVLGATATGKTRLAVALARELGGEIISADSRQVFRGMDIGSGKDLDEYGAVPYHLIDILEAGAEFSVFEFQRRFLKAFEEITARGRLPLLCGGTGLYLDAALRGYRLIEVPVNPELRVELSGMGSEELGELLRDVRPGQHNTSDLMDRERTVRAIEIATYEREHAGGREPWPDIRPLSIGIRRDRAVLRRRITERLQERLAGGLIEEVRRLHEGGIPWERLDYYGLEYRWVGSFLRGEISRNDMVQRLNSAIHDFAKRQETWFRRMERHGIAIHWVDGAGDPVAEALHIITDRTAKIQPVASQL